MTLARRATTKEEAPNKKLATLARVFGTRVTPNHRALEDARATSEVLHGMLERLARFGITHREDLDALRNPVPEKLRMKAPMADRLPSQPGVYVFRGPQGEHLYVGTSKNIRSRVKTYFTRGEQRRQIREMLELAVAVDAHVCATDIEARIVEVRMIDRYRPRYNRRSARPERTPFLEFTDERYPRLRVTRSSDGGLSEGSRALVGPMRGTSNTKAAIEAVERSLGVRTCTTRLTIVPRAGARACLLKDLGQCSAPCVDGASSGYDEAVSAARDALTRDPSPIVDVMATAIADFAEKQEYERAAELRDGVAAIIDGVSRSQRLRALVGVRLVAARRNGHAYDVISVVNGVLTGSARVSEGVWAACARLRDDWDEDDWDGAAPSGLVEEREMVAHWLEADGTRVVFIDGEWASPIRGAGRHSRWVAAPQSDRDTVAAFSH